jgi:hypothetical protein
MMSLICLFLVPRLKSVGFFLWSFYFFSSSLCWFINLFDRKLMTSR